jgi:hypothetical protein
MRPYQTDAGSGTAVADETTAEHAAPPRRHDADALMSVRSTDLEPYVGLRYLSKLFRFMAIILVLLLIAEVVTGLVTQGQAAIPRLLAEVSRLIVLAGLLWGIGDLAILLIDVGHDLRATRILVGRQAAHHLLEHPHDDHAVSTARAHDSGAASEGAPHRRDGDTHAR